MSFSKSFWAVALCAGSLALTSTAASAETVVIDFDNDGGVLVNEMGKKKYVVGEYVMEPVNLQGGLCFEDPGSGQCTIESTQTIEPTLYRTDGELYNLDSFYFLNNGAGSGFDNRTTIAAFNEGESDPFLTFDFFIGLALDAYAGLGVFIDVAPDSPTGNCDDLDSILCKGTGYIVTLSDDFHDIFKAVWSAEGDANARLDNITVSKERPPEVPLPAAGWLLLGGLGGLVAMKRRKASA